MFLKQKKIKISPCISKASIESLNFKIKFKTPNSRISDFNGKTPTNYLLKDERENMIERVRLKEKKRIAIQNYWLFQQAKNNF
mmetsp:Transcript_18162/g.16068  ORF Transcript_18162/g.16068 Transcript_18162/m.16068 type:complete len:83 (+) Transcript_18162:224-472(+)